MDLREQLGGSVRRQREEKMPFTMRAYHKHFEGYSETIVKKKNGKTKVRYEYTGEYYCPDLSSRQYVLIRLLYGCLYLLAIAFFIYSGSRNVTVNTAWYVALPQAAAVMALFWCLVGLCCYINADRKMTVGVWRGSAVRLKRASAASAGCLGIVSLAVLLYELFNRQPPSEWLLLLCCYLLSALLMIGIYKTECNISYNNLRRQELKNDNKSN